MTKIVSPPPAPKMPVVSPIKRPLKIMPVRLFKKFDNPPDEIIEKLSFFDNPSLHIFIPKNIMPRASTAIIKTLETETTKYEPICAPKSAPTIIHATFFISRFFARKYAYDTGIETIISTKRLVPKITGNGKLKKVERIGTKISTPEAPVTPDIAPTINPNKISSRVNILLLYQTHIYLTIIFVL